MSEHYELTYIVSIKHLDDELKKVMNEVAGFIKGFGGVVTSEQVLGKQRLAYPIKQTHQGTYVVTEFNIETENVLPLDKQMILETSVLRHLIVKKKIQTEEEKKREKQVQERLIKEKEDEIEKLEKDTKKFVKKEEVSEKARFDSEARRVESPIKKEKKAAVGSDQALEDLDKKLDQILTDDLL